VQAHGAPSVYTKPEKASSFIRSSGRFFLEEGGHLAALLPRHIYFGSVKGRKFNRCEEVSFHLGTTVPGSRKLVTILPNVQPK
jgi:hypothetical protein